MNFKEFINESTSVDLDYTPTSYQGANDDYDNNVITHDELIDILYHMEEETKDIILSALNAYFGNNPEIPYYYTIDELIGNINKLSLENLYLHAEIIGSVLADIEDQIIDIDADNFDFSSEEDLFNENIIDVSHTRQLRRNRKRASWKRQAIIRARYRKTGEGKRERKKAIRYLKKYRKRKKTKLKRYADMYKRRWNGKTSY